MHTFLRRVSSRQSPSPTVVAQVMQGVVAGTPLQETPLLFGDKETVQRKRARSKFGKNSHRPGFEMESRQRKKHGCPRKIVFESQESARCHLEGNFARKDANCADEMDQDYENDAGSMDACECLPQEEAEVSNCKWAIRRMPIHCVRKCFGMVKGKRCTNIIQSRSPGLVAPCFWGERTYNGKTQQQWIWFCSHDVCHTQKVSKQVKDPPKSPISWWIATGTTITKAEKSSLEGAGFLLRCTYSRSHAKTCSEDQNLIATSSSRPKKWRPGVSKEAKKRLENASLKIGRAHV